MLMSVVSVAREARTQIYARSSVLAQATNASTTYCSEVGPFVDERPLLPALAWLEFERHIEGGVLTCGDVR